MAGGAAGGTRAGYECRDWLPVNELGGATRHPAHLTEEQVAQRVRQQVEASLDPGGPILQLSDETYFLDPEGHWVVSTQSTRYRNSRTEVETLLRQRMRGLRSVSFQLPCEEDVLPSAFEDKPLCVPRQLAELLQLSVEEVCADFDAMLRHDWRRLGISAEEVREFCVWRNAPMRVLSSQGDLVDSYDPALKEHRTVCFLAFDGHCYMYRAVKRVLERQAARVLYRGEARQTLPPIQEWRRFDAADVQPGLFWCEDLREARRQLMAAGESPKVAMSSPAQYTGKTYLARTIVARLREQGEAVHLVSKTHCSAQNLGLGAQTADHWVRRYVRGGSAQKLDWLVVEEITQLDMALSARRWSTSSSSATWPAGTGTSSRRTCAPTPASSTS